MALFTAKTLSVSANCWGPVLENYRLRHVYLVISSELTETKQLAKSLSGSDAENGFEAFYS